METQKKAYLVDVPVQVFLWIRPELQRRQFEVIKQARPSILFVISDGGRNEEEWSAIMENRNMYDTEIDWDCQVYKLYSDHNMGMYTATRRMYDLVFSHTDHCIFMEDDILPSVSYFRFCAELLERYKNDTRVFCICGMNHLGTWDRCSSDYFFSRYGSIWAPAFWKRSYDEYYHLDYGKDHYTRELLEKMTEHRPAHRKQLRLVADYGMYDGHVPGDEFYMNFSVYAYHQVMIIPKYNLISNIGCDEHASHGDSLDRLPRGIRRVFNMKTYELRFPLKHPQYLIPDVDYENERNKIMVLDHPVRAFGRNLERVFLIAKSGDFSYLKKKIDSVRKTKQIKEK